MAINGLKHKKNPMDVSRRCTGYQCGKVFYVPHSVNGQSVKCPYCGKEY
ncbi:hypothetical protein [Enterococcus sp. AZ109]